MSNQSRPEFPPNGWLERLLSRIVTPDDIGFDGSLYMRRFKFIKSSRCGFGVRLHHIMRHDADDLLHDHPFWFASLILSGGYVEERPAESWNPGGPRMRVHRKPLTINWMTETEFHRIVELPNGPVWTFVIVGPCVRRWGFWVNRLGRWVDAREVDWREVRL